MRLCQDRWVKDTQEMTQPAWNNSEWRNSQLGRAFYMICHSYATGFCDPQLKRWWQKILLYLSLVVAVRNSDYFAPNRRVQLSTEAFEIGILRVVQLSYLSILRLQTALMIAEYEYSMTFELRFWIFIIIIINIYKNGYNKDFLLPFLMAFL